MPEERGDFNADSVPIASVHNNVSQIVITTTEDKLENILGHYENIQLNSKSWRTPFCILVTLISTLMTSTLNDNLLPREYWIAVYAAAIGATIFWTVGSIYKSWKAWRGRMSIPDIIEQIKGL